MDKLSPSDEQLAELKAKHDEVWVLRSSVIDVVVKMPSLDQFSSFTQQIMSDGQKAAAPKALLNGCMIWPTRAEYEMALKRKPGVSIQLQKELVSLSGLDEKIEVEKA